jgi:hypothetical protein
MALYREFPAGTEENKENLIRTSGLWAALETRDVPHTEYCQFDLNLWYIADAHC